MNLEKLRNSRGQIWLNVGCGPRVIPEFINLDTDWLFLLAPFFPVLRSFLKTGARTWLGYYLEARKNKAARFKFVNCSRPLRVPAGSVDHILASHFLEHLDRRDAVRVVEGFYRALRSGGTLHVIVPDAEACAKEYLTQIDKPDAADEFASWFYDTRKPKLPARVLTATGIFGGAHLWIYDRRTIGAVLTRAGFELLEKNETPSADWLATYPRQVSLAARKP